jgi:formate hydrogenlyase subunit 3/multisubunit Na+/H+ antiporter MnhD subunit
MLRVLFTAFCRRRASDDRGRRAACASLAVGNLAALVQTRVKRLLAYSSISHAGFMLIAIASNNELGAKALVYYLIPYSAMSLGAFGVVTARERELGGREVTLENLAGMGWERPLLGVSMWPFMLGFAGLPPTGGFLGKFYVFSAAYDRGWLWLVIVGIAATAVSLYYYLAVIRALYLRPSAELQFAAGGHRRRTSSSTSACSRASVVTVGSFFAAGPLIDLAGKAVQRSGLRQRNSAGSRAGRTRLSAGSAASRPWTAKTARQAIAAETAARGTVPSARSGARSAAATRSARVRPDGATRSCAGAAARLLELLFHGGEPGDDDRGHGGEEAIEGSEGTPAASKTVARRTSATGRSSRRVTRVASPRNRTFLR